MQHLSPTATSILASAYQLSGEQVQHDAIRIQDWVGSELDLLEHLRQEHGWSIASEYSPHYLSDVRQALVPVRRNGVL
jgi:hypothetical protein